MTEQFHARHAHHARRQTLLGKLLMRLENQRDL
jgi:hypothetical protein